LKGLRQTERLTWDLLYQVSHLAGAQRGQSAPRPLVPADGCSLPGFPEV
jgi:hypothetical protein